MTKRELFHFSFHDHTGITRHLEQMAQKGWILESAGFFWKYSPCAPQNIRYAVTYFSDAADPDNPLGEKESLFRDLCESAGWEFVARYHEMQIFRNFQKNPVPLDTEPMVQVETIHKGMKSGRLSSLFWMLFYPLLFYFRAYLTGDLMGYLTFLGSNLYLLSILVFTVLFAVNLWELTAYYRWRRRAKAAAREGQFLSTSGRCWPHVLADCATLILLVCLVWALVLYFAPRGEDYPDNKYDWGPIHYSIYHDEMPLYMDDLVLVPKADYSNHLEESSSLFLRYTKGDIELRRDRREGNDAPRDLEYTIWTSRFDSLLDMAEKEVRKNSILFGTYQPIAAVSEAQATWQLCDEGVAREQYLLRFEDRVIEIEFSFSPTPEQMATAIEKLLEH